MPPIVKKKGAWILLVAGLVLAWGALTFYRSFSGGAVEEPKGVYVEGDTVSPRLPLVGMATTRGATLADYKGKALLLNFWAGWCGPCLKEMPALYKLHEKYAPRGFAVLAFNMDDMPEQGLEALKKIGGTVPFPLYRGYEQAVFSHFPVEGLPFTVLMNREGKVVYAQPGERDWMDAESHKLIEGLL